MHKRINVGIIGYGLSGRFFHSAILIQHEHFELKMICTSQVKRKDQITKELPEVAICESPYQIIENSEIDLVVLAVPNYLHYDLARDCIHAGKNIVVEKPFTTYESEAKNLKRLSERHETAIFVFHNRRWDGDFLLLKDFLQNSDRNDWVSLEAYFDRFRPEVKTGWKEENQLGSGILYDLGSHLIDQALVLFGCPESVYADLRIEREQAKVYDSFDIYLFYEGAKRIVLTASQLKKGNLLKYRLRCKHSNLLIPAEDKSESAVIDQLSLKEISMKFMHKEYDYSATIEKEDASQTVSIPPTNYTQFYDDLAQSLLFKKPFSITLDEVIAGIRIIELAEKSHDLRKVIKF
ncbi:MAG: Gfo/Idh/MocA family oxidoreductase [Cyclobacteriaceae bacterium]|nr:Gfo/Idh/MocA family oxidoreductase [Cyclobacteriaceae bacterium]MCH8515560.1 Gfo/Idh/MocA family oxidoreductase [Cyclobacteriaceae bacterium]